jgi:protein arginine N-methyltransferase 1
MSCIKGIALTEPLVDTVDSRQMMSTECTILDLDLYTVTTADLVFAHKYSLTITRDDTVHALVAWFDVGFTRLQHPTILSTSPLEEHTHWKHSIFYLSQPFVAKKDSVLNGSIAVRRSRANFRDLDIKLSFHFTEGETAVNFAQMYKLR